MKKVWLTIFTIIFLGLYLQSKNKENADESKPEIKVVKDETPKINIPKKNEELSVSTQSIKEIKPTSQTVVLEKKVSNRGEDFIPFDEKGRRYITQINVVGKHLIYHGDLLLGNIQDLEKFQKQQIITQAKPQKWPKGEVPFTIDESLPNINEIAEAIDYLQQNSNVKFIPKDKHQNFVHFTLGESDCYSYAGMKGGEQEIFLTPQCKTKEILHEVMHTLGFLHEQNREDRDAFVKVLWENIEDINHTQFKKIPNDFLGIKNRPFDFHSIMMYSSFMFSMIEGEPALLTKDDRLINNQTPRLSPEDLLRLGIAYP